MHFKNSFPDFQWTIYYMSFKKSKNLLFLHKNLHKLGIETINNWRTNLNIDLNSDKSVNKWTSMLINLVNLKFCSIQLQECNVTELNISLKIFKFLLITRLISFEGYLLKSNSCKFFCWQIQFPDDAELQKNGISYMF